MSDAIHNYQDITCPVARTTQIISGKWTLLIIRDLAQGTMRFSQIERSLVGISPKTLSDRLHNLERDGIIRRQTFAEVPPRVEYSLTEKGRALAEVIEAMRIFGRQWLNEDCGCDEAFLEDEHAVPLATMQPA
ncbi:MAG: helix-turn-helix transcriptional regulator [Ktedonobacterales bacterium]|nr:helix-turn-helix transcriptional regulator [Ktedonobacterales bacterium]